MSLVVTWAVLGVLSAALFWSLHQLSAGIGALNVRIDGLSDRIDALDARLTARLDQLNARMDAHMDRHSG